MKTILVECFLKLIALLPLSIARLLARAITTVLGLFNNEISRITKLNLKMTQPQLTEAELKILTHQSVTGTLINVFEMPIIWQKDDSWVTKKILNIKNEALMTTALAENKGLIVICPHIGNWEIFGRTLPFHATTTNMYQPPKITAVENLVRRGRERSGAKLVPTNQRGIAALLKALRAGEIVGILPDQVPHANAGEFSQIYGVPVYTMTLIHSLIKKTQCKVILGYGLRAPGGFNVVYQQAPEGIYSQDTATSLRALNEMVEMAINDDMAQYQWAYKRFRAQPEGLENPY